MEEKEETGEGHLKISNMVLKDFYEIKMIVLWILSLIQANAI